MSDNSYQKQPRVRRHWSPGHNNVSVKDPGYWPLRIEELRSRRVTCTCGWSGPVSSLKNPSEGPSMAGRSLGPGFPVCPKCRTDQNLGT